jgi:hypothetical protein
MRDCRFIFCTVLDRRSIEGPLPHGGGPFSFASSSGGVVKGARLCEYPTFKLGLSVSGYLEHVRGNPELLEQSHR